MKIISPFKDYYDYVSHIYGVDESITYVRKPIENCPAGGYEMPITDAPLHPWGDVGGPHYKWLAVCGRIYLLISYDYTTWNLLNDREWDGFRSRRGVSWWNSGYRHSIIDLDGSLNDKVLQVSRKIGAPVFTFTSNQRRDVVTIDELIPILGDIGFAARMPPEQTYQELSYFLCNTIKSGPDEMPVSPMTDKERITSHGFDLKQSFRHRV